MTTGPGRGVASRLASTPLVLAAPGAGGSRKVAVTLALVAALGAGAAGTHLYWLQRVGPLPQQATLLADLQQAQQALEQARLQQRVATARGQELERQIDALNQKLRECQVDLAFVRGARGGPH
jgi:uncharacterized protein HemX